MPRKSRKQKEAVPAEYQPGFLLKLDGRTEVARLLRQRFDCICDDLGGEAELSHLRRSLVERAVFLEAVLQDLECQMATARQPRPAAPPVPAPVGNGKGKKGPAPATAAEAPAKAPAKEAADIVGKWVQATNSYVGLCARLGLDRKAKQMDVNAYAAANGIATSTNGSHSSQEKAGSAQPDDDDEGADE